MASVPARADARRTRRLGLAFFLCSCRTVSSDEGHDRRGSGGVRRRIDHVNYSFDCGCPDTCTGEILNRFAGDFKCGDRIDYSMGSYGGSLPEDDACHKVSNYQFPDVCGPECDPTRCNLVPTDPPTPVPTPDFKDYAFDCGCAGSCTDEILNRYAGAFKCGDRIDYSMGSYGGSLSEYDACHKVSNYQFPSVCGPECDPSRCNAVPTDPPSLAPTGPRCGCSECTQEVWDSAAGAFTCGSRIEWLQTTDGGNYTETDACIKVANEQFPYTCGSSCDPTRCDQSRAPVTVAPSFSPAPHTDGKTNLYCFPDIGARVQYTNVWGKYTVEVKEGNLCGPGPNKFGNSGVLVQGDTLTMTFKKVGMDWEASEVRIILPEEEMPYSYGTFSFNVKSVKVLEGDNTSVSGVLPEDLVLGVFTWDIQDRHEVNQNWKHEVDFEMSRWGDASNGDMQFVVQPGAYLQKHRFFSGTDGSSYDQSGHTHSFTWHPGHLSWSSTAGGGQDFEYTTEFAITNELEDMVQCLPSAIDLRINLWNTKGNINPAGMTDGQRVEVEIDNFTFTESNDLYVAPGGFCSKHCQCEAVSGCVNGQCDQP